MSITVNIVFFMGDYDYRCSVCSKQFDSLESLGSHIIAVHGRVETSVVCPVCGKEFASVASVLSHKRFHDDEYREKMSKRSREARKSKEYKEKMSRSGKEYRRLHPEIIEQSRDRMNRLWSSPEWRSMMIERSRAGHDNSDYSAKASERAKKQWSNPETKRKMVESRHRTISSGWSDDMKRFYDDPEFAKELILSFGYPPTTQQLKKRLGLDTVTVPRTVYRHGLQDYVDFKYTHSKNEIELRDHIVEHTGTRVEPDREVLDGLELDMLVGGTNIAIEYNGCYWHSLVSSDYHLSKTRMCESKGVRLIHVFENEYVHDRERIESYIDMLIDDDYDEDDLMSSIAVEECDGLSAVVDRSKSDGSEFSRFGWRVVGSTPPRAFYVVRNGLVRVDDTETYKSNQVFTMYDCGSLMLAK